MKMKQFLKNQKGQGVMEYVIVCSLVGVICLTAVKGFGKVIQERVEDMKEQISEHIENK